MSAARVGWSVDGEQLNADVVYKGEAEAEAAVEIEIDEKGGSGG
jgi:hypothetical protein